MNFYTCFDKQGKIIARCQTIQDIEVLNKMELVDDDYLKIISKKLEDLSKKKVLVISSSLKKGLSSLLSEVWKRI